MSHLGGNLVPRLSTMIPAETWETCDVWPTSLIQLYQLLFVQPFGHVPVNSPYSICNYHTGDFDPNLRWWMHNCENQMSQLKSRWFIIFVHQTLKSSLYNHSRRSQHFCWTCILQIEHKGGHVTRKRTATFTCERCHLERSGHLICHLSKWHLSRISDVSHRAV